MRCEVCQHHFPLREAEATAYVDKAVLWERAVNGRRKPIICPECKNAQFFVKERLALVAQIQNVEITSQGNSIEQDTLNTEERDTVTLCYRCAVEGCKGVITVNEDTFKVTPL
jgi:hypothetical protein